jgi:hypothetical protein
MLFLFANLHIFLESSKFSLIICFSSAINPLKLSYNQLIIRHAKQFAEFLANFLKVRCLLESELSVHGFACLVALRNAGYQRMNSTLAAFTDYLKKAARCFVAPGDYFSLINISDGFRLSLIPHLTVLL